MRSRETLVEMARRHVSEGEAHVRKQCQIVARLFDRGLPADDALRLLATFEGALEDHRASLARIEEEQGLGLRDASGQRVWIDDPSGGR